MHLVRRLAGWAHIPDNEPTPAHLRSLGATPHHTGSEDPEADRASGGDLALTLLHEPRRAISPAFSYADSLAVSTDAGSPCVPVSPAASAASGAFPERPPLATTPNHSLVALVSSIATVATPSPLLSRAPAATPFAPFLPSVRSEAASSPASAPALTSTYGPAPARASPARSHYLASSSSALPAPAPASTSSEIALARLSITAPAPHAPTCGPAPASAAEPDHARRLRLQRELDALAALSSPEATSLADLLPLPLPPASARAPRLYSTNPAAPHLPRPGSRAAAVLAAEQVLERAEEHQQQQRQRAVEARRAMAARAQAAARGGDGDGAGSGDGSGTSDIERGCRARGGAAAADGGADGAGNDSPTSSIGFRPSLLSAGARTHASDARTGNGADTEGSATGDGDDDDGMESPTAPSVGDAHAAPLWIRAPYVTSGYRLGYGARECVLSLCALHNETCNVWTHLAGLAVFAVLGLYRAVTTLADAAPAFRVSFGAFYLGVCLCMALSSAYHLFGCMSSAWQTRLYRLDMTGVCLMVLGSFIPGLVVAFHCHPQLQKLYLFIVSMLNGLSIAAQNLRVCLEPRFFTPRIALTFVSAAFALVPTIHFAAIAPAEQLAAFFPMQIAAISLYAAGFVFWLTKFPERYYPGKFDLWLGSHGIWHTFVVLAPLTWDSGLVSCLELIKSGAWVCP